MKYILLSFLLLIPFVVFAETMFIQKTDGTTVEVPVANITSITFSNVAAEDLSQFIEKVPLKFLKNYPNPFNPVTTISFNLNYAQTVKVDIYNLKGQKVRQLTDDFLEAGSHEFTWDGKDDNRKAVATGTYFYQITTDEKQYTKKMLMLK